MNTLFFALALVAPQQQDISQKSFVERFDEAMSLAVATRLLVNEGFNGGYPIIRSVSSLENDLLREFGMGLPTYKETVKGHILFDEVREAIKIDSVNHDFVKEIVNGENYPSQMFNMTKHLDSVRKYLESSNAEKIMEIRFPMIRPGKMLRWFLFFKLNDNDKWRLEFACPQIVIYTRTFRLRPEIFFVPPVGISFTTFSHISLLRQLADSFAILRKAHEPVLLAIEPRWLYQLVLPSEGTKITKRMSGNFSVYPR